MNTESRIDFMRKALLVRRYHQYYVHDADTVGKHSAGVALFVNLIDPAARKEVIMAALTHDLGELETGDIPAPTKRKLSEKAKEEIDLIEEGALSASGFSFTDQITDDEYLLVKLGDYFDGLSFCTEELMRGNSTLRHVGLKYRDYLYQLLNSEKIDQMRWALDARLIFTILNNRWETVA